MVKFTLKRIEAIQGKQVFTKLCIDDICLFDEFEQSIKNNPKYVAELSGIYLYMERVSNLESLPNTKFRDITPGKESINEYEFKSKNLRVYAIKTRDGKIVVLGGTKNKQKRDIRSFRTIKKRYIESIRYEKRRITKQ